MLFILKKIIVSFITFPGLFIVILIGGGLIVLKKNRVGLFSILVGLSIYLVSIPIVGNNIIASVESHVKYRAKKGDCIILLGGGISEGIEDLTGIGIPHPDVLERIVEARRIWHRLKIPVIISGGSVYGGTPEADVVKRYLIELGIPKRYILCEKKSRDTVENAQLIKLRMQREKLTRGILITSSYHIKRAHLIFAGEGLITYPHSAGSKSEKIVYQWVHFLPTIHDFYKTSLAIKEHVGIMVYSLKYRKALKSYTYKKNL
jgi:uncharacterized SAM-binding protein YcdF (DUF218 family)